MEERKGYISQTTGRRRWRAPDVIRGFRWDREGVHLPVGFIIAGLLWAGMTHYAYINILRSSLRMKSVRVGVLETARSVTWALPW